MPRVDSYSLPGWVKRLARSGSIPMPLSCMLTFQPSRYLHRGEMDVSALGCEFDGVGKKVPHDGLNLMSVRPNDGIFRNSILHSNALILCNQVEQADAILRRGAQIDFFKPGLE